jgi:hypothetical protein
MENLLASQATFWDGDNFYVDASGDQCQASWRIDK